MNRSFIKGAFTYSKIKANQSLKNYFCLQINYYYSVYLLFYIENERTMKNYVFISFYTSLETNKMLLKLFSYFVAINYPKLYEIYKNIE